MRYGSFVMSLMKCVKPEGSQVIFNQSISITENWNSIIRAMTGDWLWIQADDHTWEPDALTRLLDRDVDVIVPLIIRRGPPFVPVIFKDEVKEGYVPFAYSEIPNEPFKVHMAGSGGMLVKKHVLEAIDDPWFEYEAGEKLNEDFNFVRKVKAAGFDVWCDPTVVFGHISMFTVFPSRQEGGGWRIGFDVGTSKNGQRSIFYFDPAEEQRKEDKE